MCLPVFSDESTREIVPWVGGLEQVVEDFESLVKDYSLSSVDVGREKSTLHRLSAPVSDIRFHS